MVTSFALSTFSEYAIFSRTASVLSTKLNEDASAPLRMVAPGVVREIIAVLIVS